MIRHDSRMPNMGFPPPDKPKPVAGNDHLYCVTCPTCGVMRQTMDKHNKECSRCRGEKSTTLNVPCPICGQERFVRTSNAKRAQTCPCRTCSNTKKSKKRWHLKRHLSPPRSRDASGPQACQ